MIRNRITATWLAVLLGAFGVQKFYVGRNAEGVLCFLFAFTFIPALIGIVDAIRWLRMSEPEFERQYGIPIIKGLFPDSESKNLRTIRTMLLMAWKMIHVLSWTVLPFFLITPIGIAIPAALLWWFALVLVMAVIMPKIALRVRHPLIRYLLDPIGPDIRAHQRHRMCDFEVWLQAYRGIDGTASWSVLPLRLTATGTNLLRRSGISVFGPLSSGISNRPESQP